MSSDTMIQDSAPRPVSIRGWLNRNATARSGQASSVLVEAAMILFFWRFAHAKTIEANVTLLGVSSALMAAAAIWAWAERLRVNAIAYSIAAVLLVRWWQVSRTLSWEASPNLGWLASFVIMLSVIHLLAHATRPWADRARAARAARAAAARPPAV